MRTPTAFRPAGSSDGPALPDFRLLFEATPGLCLVLTPESTILAASDAYLNATRTARQDIVGRRLLELLPDGALGASLARVLAERASDTITVDEASVRRLIPEGTDRRFKAINSPLFGPTGEVTYVLHRIEDITEGIARVHELQR